MSFEAELEQGYCFRCLPARRKPRNWAPLLVALAYFGLPVIVALSFLFLQSHGTERDSIRKAAEAAVRADVYMSNLNANVENYGDTLRAKMNGAGTPSGPATRSIKGFPTVDILWDGGSTAEAEMTALISTNSGAPNPEHFTVHLQKYQSGWKGDLASPTPPPDFLRDR